MMKRNCFAESTFIKFVSERTDGEHECYNYEVHPLPMPSQPPEWEPYPLGLRLVGLTPRVARALSVTGSDDTTFVTLFDSACEPWTSVKNMERYIRKLRVLSRLLL